MSTPGAGSRPLTCTEGTPAAGSGRVLLGAPAETPWEPALSEAMHGAGRAVREERLPAGSHR